jgi:peptidoglycan-associated lipoprotein
MPSRYTPAAGLVTVAVAILHQMSDARAQEPMRLGVPPAAMAGEFQAVVGDRVFFSEGSVELSPRGRTAVQAQANWLRRNVGFAVTVEGHADDRGTSEQNYRISQRRADVVRQQLIEMGVPPERVRAIANGRERVVADCPNPACAAQNRRVVTVVERTWRAPFFELLTGRSRQDAARPPRRLY